MTLKQRILKVQDMALCLCRKWWRPLSCLGFVAAIWVNMVAVPWRTGKPIEFDKGSLFVTAVVAAFAVREWGKARGTADK